jgi:hypothetical protein
MKPQDPERQYINDSPLDLSGREGYDAPSKCPVCGQRLNGGAHRGNCTARAQAASVDETLDKSTLDLLREIEQRAQKIHRTAELYANDEIAAHETVNQIVTIKTLLNQAIVKELSK